MLCGQSNRQPAQLLSIVGSRKSAMPWIALILRSKLKANVALRAGSDQVRAAELIAKESLASSMVSE